MHKFFHFAPRASGNKGKSMCWPDTKKSTNEKKRLKRKIDKWYNHHKISNKNITKGEIPMALKNTQRNGPLKNSKKKRIHRHLKKTTRKSSSNQIFVFKNQSWIPSKKLPLKKRFSVLVKNFFVQKILKF